MLTISLCMIVKDEEATLERCLNSVEGAVDEIVIVDTGSTDATKEIASKFTSKIYDFDWIDDFSAARNYSFAQATMDYIMWLDADDILLPEDAVKLKALKETMPPDTGSVMMKYNTGFDARGRVTFSYYRERLVNRSLHFKWIEPVHEYLEAAGGRMVSDISVTHAKPPGRIGVRNIRIYENLLDAGEDLSPRSMYYYARELRDHGRYADAVKWFGIFLDSGKGWIEDNISACGEMAKCHLILNEPLGALLSMIRSFSYDSPRAEICCQLGYFYKDQREYKQAAFWFELARTLEESASNLGFRQEDCWGYTPCIELAVCYDKLGDPEKATALNDIALAFKPDSPAALYNKKYFDNKLANRGA